MVDSTNQLSQNLNASLSSSKSAPSGRDMAYRHRADSRKANDMAEDPERSFASRMLLSNSSTQTSLAGDLSTSGSASTSAFDSPTSSNMTFQSFGTNGSLASAATLSSPIGGPSPLARSYSSATDTIASPSSPLIQRASPGSPFSSPIVKGARSYGHAVEPSQGTLGTLGHSDLAYAGISFEEVQPSMLDGHLQLSPNGTLADISKVHVTFEESTPLDTTTSPKFEHSERSKFSTSARNIFTAPLMIRKRKSKIGLGEAFEPVVPVLRAPLSSSTSAPTSPNPAVSSPKAGPGSPITPLSRSTTSRFASFLKGPSTSEIHSPTSSPRIMDLVDSPSTSFPALHELHLPDPAYIEEARKRKLSQPCPPSSPKQSSDIAAGCVSPKQTWSRAFARRAVSAETAPNSPKVTKDVQQSPSPSSPVAAGLPKTAPQPVLLQGIQHPSFAQYADRNFGQHRKTGLFGKQRTIQDIMKWQAVREAELRTERAVLTHGPLHRPISKRHSSLSRKSCAGTLYSASRIFSMSWAIVFAQTVLFASPSKMWKHLPPGTQVR